MARRSVKADGLKVERRRLEMGFSTQGALAEAAGVNQSTVSRMERGVGVQPDSAEAVARALGVDLRDLAENADDDPDLVDVWTYSGATLSGGQPFAIGQHAGSYRVSSPEERGHNFQLFSVSGECMAPRIEGGDKVVVDTTRANDWREGDTVAVRHEGALLVKRIEGRPSYPATQPILVANDGTRLIPDADTRVLGVVVEIRKKP